MPITEYKTYKLSDLGFVGRGKSKHRPRNDPSLYGGPYPFFQTGDIKDANFWLTRFSQTYNENGLAQSKLWQVGTLCITIAANIAETAILGIPGCFPDSVVGFVPDPDKADVRFVKYYIETIKLEIQGISRGTTQDNLSLDKLLTFDFRVPPLSVQRRIAGILSAYDDLIENNQRRIKILEEMARLLYCEWFVNFRFTGHEKVPLVDSPLGKIPKGWEITRVHAMTSFLNRGLSPKYNDEGESLVVNQKCIRDRRLNLEPARRQGKPIPEEKLIRFGDVVINSTGVGTLGRVAQVYDRLENCTVDTHVTIVRPKETVNVDFFGLALLNKQETFERSGTGATGQTELSRSAIGQVQLITPPTTLQKRFGTLVHSMRSEISILLKQAGNLRRTRDLLLPRLLSGSINFNDLPAEGDDTGTIVAQADEAPSHIGIRQ